MSRIKTTILATFAVVLGLMTACVAGSSQEEIQTTTPKPPIDLTLKDLEGQVVHLRDLQGQVVLVNYWASWCSPCRDEMPILDSFYQAHQSDGFTLLSINVSESAEDAAEYVMESGYTFPVWSDPTGNTMIELGINGLPASILLDDAGRIQKVWLGPLTEAMLEEAVLPMLENQ
ncbi:MAG: TlpA disulfide reductase family protein [Chloroflexota bacterium]|nr:TlpA disulfide reductase family protein [Chloroflexota bacterium]